VTITETYFPTLKNEISGWMVKEKMQYFEKLYAAYQPKVTCELGVWMGLSAIAQGIIIRELGLDCKLYAVDAYSKEAAIEGSNSEANTEWWLGIDFEEAKQSFLASIKKYGLEDIIVPLFGKSSDMVYNIPDNIDICHFDSNHSAEVISREFHLYAPKLSGDSCVVLDDYFWVESNEAYTRLCRKFKLEKYVMFEIEGQGFAVYKKKKVSINDIAFISIRLEGERWDKRVAEANSYFTSQGIGVYWVRGIHAER